MYNIPLTILFLAIIIFLVIGCVAYSLALFRRAVLSIVEIFREHNAVEEENAITTVEIGCKPRTIIDFLNPGLRNYRVEALEFLIKYGIVQVTVENKFYLCEERLVAMIPALQPY